MSPEQESRNPKFPQEIYVHILSQLPAQRNSDTSVHALVACASANLFLRAAATTSVLWKPHYMVRYPHCRSEIDEDEEEWRRQRCGGNWWRMYLERRQMDKEALELIDSLITCRRRRKGEGEGSAGETGSDAGDKPLDEVEVTELVHESLRAVVRLGVAVLDGLDILEQDPVPSWFRGKHEQDVSHVAPHSLPRRYWAAALRGLILRHDAVTLWIRMRNQGGRMVPMERAFAGLSSFFGIGYLEIKLELDAVAERCRQHLVSLGVELDPASHKYDLSNVCVEICSYMRAQGFRAQDVGSWSRPSDLFPHRFLKRNRRNIPMCLLCVFISICRRLDIVASPTDFPFRVLAHVSPRDPSAPAIYVDVFGSEEKAIVSVSEDLPVRLADYRVPLSSMPRWIVPCGSDSSLLRQAKNILVSFHLRPGVRPPSPVEVELSFYAAACVYTILGDDDVCINKIVDLEPLDLKTILMDVIAEGVFPRVRDRLMALCGERLVVEQKENAVWRRSQVRTEPKYFAGLVFVHEVGKYFGTIVGWKDGTSEPNLEDNKIYYSFLADATVRAPYVLEEDIIPVPLTRRLVQGILWAAPKLAKHFEDVEVAPGENGRGRLLMSPAMKRRFPEDDEAGRRWVAEGIAEPSR